jgi:hypothetical protein
MNARQLIESDDVTDRLEQAFDLQHLAKVGDLKKRLDREISPAAAVCAYEFTRYWRGGGTSWKSAFKTWFEDDFFDHPALEKALDLNFEMSEIAGDGGDDGLSQEDKIYGRIYRKARELLKKRYDE